jgi:hypothetical protein
MKFPKLESGDWVFVRWADSSVLGAPDRSWHNHDEIMEDKISYLETLSFVIDLDDTTLKVGQSRDIEDEEDVQWSGSFGIPKHAITLCLKLNVPQKAKK